MDTLRVTTRVVVSNQRIPNPFWGAPSCPQGTTLVDKRRDKLGEASCQHSDGTRHGFFASNVLHPPKRSIWPEGFAERGQYHEGARHGSWYTMRWSWPYFDNPLYERVEYDHGTVVTRQALGPSQETIKRCANACVDTLQRCENRPSCPPGVPCVQRDCQAEKLSCEITCQGQVKCPWW